MVAWALYDLETEKLRDVTVQISLFFSLFCRYARCYSVTDDDEFSLGPGISCSIIILTGLVALTH